MNRRRGYFLVEAVVMMLVGSVILGLTVGLLHTVFRTQSAARDHVRRCAVLSRLSDRFRRDVHAATHQGTGEPVSEPAGGVADGKRWQFVLAADRTVTYSLEPGRLLRVERVGQEVKQRELFSLPPDTTATIETQGETKPAMVSLLIAPTPEATGQPAKRTMRIDAVLGKDHRLTKPAEPAGEESPSSSEDTDG